MKKLSVIFISVLLIVSFVSCGKKANVNEPIGDTIASIQSVYETPSGDMTTEASEQVGATVKMSVCNKDNLEQYYNITFPTDDIREILYGIGSATTEGLWAFSGGTFFNETIECSSIEEIFEAYSDRWSETAQDMHDNSAYSDCKFVAEKREMTEINGFSMCRYEGTHTYNHTDFSTGAVTPYSCYFVAYGTQLSEGGYVYWVVFDNSADQSLKDLVNTSTENMAKSLEETTLF